MLYKCKVGGRRKKSSRNMERAVFLEALNMYICL